MNISNATPVSLPINTANIPTELVQTENRLAERIPETKQTFDSLASKAARSNDTGPTQSSAGNSERTEDDAKPKIIGSKEEQGRNQSESEDRSNPQAEQQQAQEQREIQKLAAIDRKVKAHEQAHSSVGGVYAGSPSYTYKTGPNGVRYAVAGEVPIDVSPVPGNPEATVRKAEQVARAALAPADPSPTDRRVASAASALASKARFEVMQMASEKAQNTVRINQDEDEQQQGPLPYAQGNTSFAGGQLRASLKTNATEQVGGQVSASA